MEATRQTGRLNSHSLERVAKWEDRVRVTATEECAKYSLLVTSLCLQLLSLNSHYLLLSHQPARQQVQRSLNDSLSAA